ncbi:hypothetical protein BGP77_11900 [Saccharospirillum sp. MSK14-1]|uniref:GNAT family N-acetyltransferase n=1 Tax=Saccharospirillum sp. MSK14-1 TaxID=1897632 RepID=UPI000D3B4F08|nr:GNAT family N-acetyltransferase [Saccharospirillum sp. MSK14-1]PTY38408.1 hypothetical protein BGP77_11900 [Saccharospirillum sp. MSK14-1]
MNAVEHRPDEQLFILSLDDGQGHLRYQINGQDIDFTSTYVPGNWRGRGLARKLVDAGLGWARQEGLNIHASCWYVQKVLERGG